MKVVRKEWPGRCSGRENDIGEGLRIEGGISYDKRNIKERRTAQDREGQQRRACIQAKLHSMLLRDGRFHLSLR